MIGWLEGRLLEKRPTRAILDVGGVGYEAWIPLSTFVALPDEGKTVALRIHTHVREEALVLYGFATAREKAAFELLLHASRVGPKLAQTILSGIEADELVEAIRLERVEVLRSAPGVGAKMAERIVVGLRDRVDEWMGEAGVSAPAQVTREEEDTRQQLVATLLNLQTPRARAEQVADQIAAEAEPETPIEELVRAALRRLAR